MIITAQPLTSRAFEPFGEFFCRLTEPGRAYTEAALGNGRPAARPSLSMALKRPLAQLPLAVFELERHAQSSQTFVPIDAGRWLMSVGLHMRLIGHPARAVGLQRLLDYMMAREDVWITRRVDIARHWQRMHPYPGKGLNE